MKTNSIISKIIVIVVITISSNLQAQNLVRNGSFEKYYKCPNNYTEGKIKKFLPSWEVPTKGSPDYFNKCSKEMVGVPQNFIGNIHAFEGVGYAGLVLLDTPEGVRKEINYREYLQAQLAIPLQKNQLYVVKFYYSVAAYSKYGINRLGIHFSLNKINKKKGVINVKPQMQIDTMAIYCNPGEWIQFSDTFRARGVEKFMTIGNFYPDSKTKYIPNNISGYSDVLQQKINTNQVAYYYLDNLSIEKIDDKNYKPDYNFSQNFLPLSKFNIANLNKPLGIEFAYLLDEVYFDSSEKNFSPVSFYQIGNLVNYLKANPNIKVSIIGLKRNTEESNAASLKRANALKDVLESNNITDQINNVRTEPIVGIVKIYETSIIGIPTTLESNLIAIKLEF